MFKSSNTLGIREVTIYSLIFCDTETTGVDEADRLIQLATLNAVTREHVNELFNPGMPISIGAMAVNHITNKMVVDKQAFKGSAAALYLEKQLKDPTSIFIAHNAPFDISMVEREGLKVGKYICTLKVAKHLDPKGTIEKYNLQYLRYYFGFEVEATAHDAFGDVLVLEQLFNREREAMAKCCPELTPSDIIDKMIELSQKPVLLPKMTFGKYKGKTFKEIPLNYIVWALNNLKDLDADVEYTLRQCLPKR